MLRGWLRSRFGTQCDVDDLVQETYLRIAQARARGEVQAPKAFLFATARNVALDQIRRLRTANAKPLAENEAFHVFDDTAGEGRGAPTSAGGLAPGHWRSHAYSQIGSHCMRTSTARNLYPVIGRGLAGEPYWVTAPARKL
jgi:RNA polymerase sigma-70 factor (ECF subfamily)